MTHLSRQDQTVIVGMSGGVDSSVAALMLIEAGYKVEGLFMKNWEEDDGTEYCTAKEDLADAQSVADQLGIHLHSANFAAEYWDGVFDHFLSEYRAGRTPNPDILCNREIKFRAFLDYATQLGADLIATGHYVQTDAAGDTTQLRKGVDGNKDQSYFLHQVNHQALGRSLFPVGNVDKTLVREKAASAGFVTARKKDSTGICFIGERRFRDFLKQYLPAQPGPIVSVDGDELGEHEGLMYHTIGQRQGLRIGGLANRPPAPWYVVGKNVTDNVLVVAQGNEHPALFKTQLTAADVIWISGEPPTLPFRCHAKIRYRQADQPCEVSATDSKVQVSFTTPQRAVTPGQSVVFYEGDICLGGGVIEAAQ
ncbi:MAG: tRNA 2-thiouridine(34) synthase MnmA [Pseudomonadota bacterium]|nr:tRNA 2-thiouridine(34) synthase MnmA [Pseudomonadota bacterium]